jgi:hypothetical protein
MTDAILTVDSGHGPRRVALSAYLDATREEEAVVAAYTWIKRLRELSVDGQPLRRRFTFRNDSLWWFAELYLHKQQTILQMFRTISAVEALVDRERPTAVTIISGDRLVHGIAPQIARVRKVVCRGANGFGGGWLPIARLDARARRLMVAAMASRFRPRPAPGSSGATPIAAFVHRAFWRSGADEHDAESYIGPVLQALSQRFPRDGVRYIGVGPPANFRARRWWHPLRHENPASRVTPIEAFAPLGALRPSRVLWRSRHAMCRALWGSADLRRHAKVGDCDCWSIIREELAGIALLQWPWSARAMDEAAAALDTLRPRVALTYAEAGGWGRALMLECRRRGIPSAGLQHGFIYRHWLNYLHEPDEMIADPDHPEDHGFPRPTLTLLFDAYAAGHLERAGRFPADALTVTGSPRLDALVREAEALSPEAIERARGLAGAHPPRDLVVFVGKYREARHLLPALVTAIADMPGVHLAIKTHPAETSDVYHAIAQQTPNIRVLPASAPLAPLLRASRAIVTVNSTVALDAAVLGVPALVIGLPNNLTPFVDAGALAGAAGPEIRPVLERILYDEEFRQQLARNRSAFLARFDMGSDGGAAERSADAIVQLTANA